MSVMPSAKNSRPLGRRKSNALRTRGNLRAHDRRAIGGFHMRPKTRAQRVHAGLEAGVSVSGAKICEIRL
jgi:hypothetical protein